MKDGVFDRTSLNGALPCLPWHLQLCCILRRTEKISSVDEKWQKYLIQVIIRDGERHEIQQISQMVGNLYIHCLVLEALFLYLDCNLGNCNLAAL